MKLLSVLIVLAGLTVLASAVSIRDHREMFEDFKTKYNKVYESKKEGAMRFAAFQENLGRIDELNSLSTSAKFGVNEFADLTRAEFANYRMKNAVVRDETLPVAPDASEEVIDALPASFDWRPLGAVTGVKNQGSCGSCWSFSATGNMEGQWFLAGNNLTGLSEQNLVSCDHECSIYEGQKSCDSGCEGGLQTNAYSYVIATNGIDTEASYPYAGIDESCKFKSNSIGTTISNFTMVSTNETQMQAYLVQHGPLAIAADAAEWQFYIGGVFDLPCGTSLDHGILIVGYDVEKDIFGVDIPFWWVKNSWGATWGESGYLKVKRGDCKCGLCDFVSSSII
eukprot:TRINITY_DN7197_c0_g1_i1.p1 TRINITY_DN7197_c0_g1~~TRINITY_DN7197_c0_g1_i1.p1  ORF type:complete len:359 (+),score=96.51 TRINITY_DN7197_c0_g1_i1:65-1078(+)